MRVFSLTNLLCLAQVFKPYSNSNYQ